MLRYLIFFILCLVNNGNAKSDVIENETIEKQTGAGINGDHTKIVGGKTIDISLVPYQISLQINKGHICGGSIIAPTFIVTAAHCVKKGTAANYTIRAGSNQRRWGGVLRNVIRIISHPKYDSFFTDYDIAVLELDEPLQFSRKIMPVALSDVEPKRGKLLLISGWGALRHNTFSHPTLLSTLVPVVPKDECRRTYLTFRPVTENMICAGFSKGGKDSCQGDSGGPAVLNKKLVGVVSWGDGCAQKNAPGVYASVAYFKNWILQQLR